MSSQHVSDRQTASSSAQSSSAQSTPPKKAGASDRALPPTAGAMDLKADRLMDEVFADLERMLERGVQLDFEPTEAPESAAPPASKPVAAPVHPEEKQPPSPLALLPKLSPRQLASDQTILLDEDIGDEAAEMLLKAAQEQDVQPENRSWDALLVMIILASLAITGLAWFFRSRLPQASPPVAVTPAPADTLQARQDAEFLDYVQRSVDRIERAKAEAVASTDGVTTSPTPTVLERVYIPIYQSPGAVPPTGALPSVPVPANPANPPIPAVPPTLTSPAAPPVAPAPAPAPSAAPAPAPATTVVPNISPAPTHVLIGLLELGDRSAALFEIDGTPQRIELGERVGSSGWTLVSVQNQEALIRRNGEVRSIYIGQQF